MLNSYQKITTNPELGIRINPACATYSTTMDGKWGVFQWDLDGSDNSVDGEVNDVIDLATGKTLWTVNINGGNVCDATSSRVLVNINDQLTTLDATTDKQISYTSNPYTDVNGDPECPKVLGTGLTGIGFNGDGDVIQLLAP